MIKVYKKGAAPLKGSDLLSCQPCSGGGDMFKSLLVGCNENETRDKTVLGTRDGEGVGEGSGHAELVEVMMAIKGWCFSALLVCG